jgi:beta-glucosidase
MVDRKAVSSGPAIPITTAQFLFNHILLEARTEAQMLAQTKYNMELIMQELEKFSIGEPTPCAAALCLEEAYSEDDTIQDAIANARKSDVSIIYAGRDSQYESEGFDLESIEHPINQIRLIQAVAAASRTTVLVLHAGNPIDASKDPEVVREEAVRACHLPLATASLLNPRR